MKVERKATVGLNRGNAGGFSDNPPDTRLTLAQAGIDKIPRRQQHPMLERAAWH
jgi:hypothetical protein